VSEQPADTRPPRRGAPEPEFVVEVDPAAPPVARAALADALAAFLFRRVEGEPRATPGARPEP
jgi:hypothetical protein